MATTQPTNGPSKMKTYETKFGTATIISGRVQTQGKWGVFATIGGKRAFLTFDGKPDLEAAFPAKPVGKIQEGYYVKDGRMIRKSSEMELENSIN